MAKVPALVQLFRRNPQYLKSAVYGANDGMITTFAVVAGAAGAGLPSTVVIILGASNIVADGLSMALGDFLGERSERRLSRKMPDNDVPAWHTGFITFLFFLLAGSIPLLPFFATFFGWIASPLTMFMLSGMATAIAMFVMGSLRTIVTKGSWIRNGLEMFFIGAAAATVAYLLGDWLQRIVMASVNI
jgi:VIT1/CCC1 family predicted Fe2+/Mn2+ transporter